MSQWGRAASPSGGSSEGKAGSGQHSRVLRGEQEASKREYIASGIASGRAVGATLISHRDQDAPKDVKAVGCDLCCGDLFCNNCLVFAYLKEDNDLEDIDSLLEKIEDTSGLWQQTQSGIIADSRPLLYVEHR